MPICFSIFHSLLRKTIFFVATAIKTRSHVESQFVDKIYYEDVFKTIYTGEYMQGKYFPLVKERRHFKLLLSKKCFY